MGRQHLSLWSKPWWIREPIWSTWRSSSFFPQGILPYLEKGATRFRLNAFFADKHLLTHMERQYGDYTPVSLSELPRLIHHRLMRVDIALIKITPPNDQGHCSLGVGVDITGDMLQQAKLVIAEVTSHMPWTCGNSQIHMDDIDYWVDCDEPLIQHALLPTDDPVLQQIGQAIASKIEDGETLQVGGETARSVLPYLEHHQKLGFAYRALHRWSDAPHAKGRDQQFSKNRGPGESYCVPWVWQSATV